MSEPALKKARTEGDRPDARPRYLALLNDIVQWDTLSMFHHPVTDDVVPGYSKIIQAPMDLATIRHRVEKRYYSDDEELVDDISLMISNALVFNDKFSVWYKHARNLKKKLPEFFKTHHVGEQPTVITNEEEADTVFMVTKRVADKETTIAKAERGKKAEHVDETLGAMKNDLDIPIEELRAKYKSVDAVKALAAAEAESCSSSTTSDDDSSSSGSSSTSSSESSSVTDTSSSEDV